MRTIVDANIILRYILNDVPEQSMAAKAVIETGVTTLPEVIAEVVYVLIGVYKIDRSIIRDALLTVLEEIEVDEADVVAMALKLYGTKSIDFVDAELYSRKQILGDHIISFDQKLNKLLEA